MVRRKPRPAEDEDPTDTAREPSAYGWPFAFAYLANTSLMVSYSLLYRYSDLVHFLGGTDVQLGWIIGIGMVGSLAMRLAQGVGIDSYGPRKVWLWSLVAFVGACLGHLLLSNAASPFIFLLRILLMTSLAGAFGASITYISCRAPVIRVAEVIGTLGTSGFVGMMLGSTLGDVLVGVENIERVHIVRMFYSASGMGLVSLVFAALATRGTVRTRLRRRPPIFALLRRYQPGAILLVGIATGVGVAVPQNFLRPFEAQLNIHSMAFFFYVYSIVAFVTRFSIRGLPAKIGIRPLVAVGLATMALSMLSYLLVSEGWHLALPAFFAGLAHACLFPSVVAGGSTNFPQRYRGLGVTLMLSSFDVGTLIGGPLISCVLLIAYHLGLPPYMTMFVTLGLLMVGIATLYQLTSREVAWKPKARRAKPRRPDVRPVSRQARKSIGQREHQTCHAGAEQAHREE